MSTPAVAPRPVPTIMDMGVARPNAHGQAMMSTATALTKAYTMRGSGPIKSQTMHVIRQMTTTAGAGRDRGCAPLRMFFTMLGEVVLMPSFRSSPKMRVYPPEFSLANRTTSARISSWVFGRPRLAGFDVRRLPCLASSRNQRRNVAGRTTVTSSCKALPSLAPNLSSRRRYLAVTVIRAGRLLRRISFSTLRNVTCRASSRSVASSLVASRGGRRPA